MHRRVTLVGSKEPVEVTCTQLNGGYGVEGAIALFSRSSAHLPPAE